MIRMGVRAFFALVLVLFAGAAQALPLDRSLGQLKHTRWTADDGAPGGVRALAQSTDGYLWIGSSTGLYRFDGQVFDHVPLIGVETSVTALLAARNGDLWIGLQNGQVILRRGGRQIDMTPSAHAKRIRQIVEDEAGGVWVQSAAYDLLVTRYFNRRWTTFGADRGVAPNFVFSIVAARDGAIWILTVADIRVLRPGQSRFEAVAPRPETLEAIFEDRGGRIWTADTVAGLRALSPASTTAAIPPPPSVSPDKRSAIQDSMFDRDGGLWGVVASHGLFRSRPAGVRPAGSAATPTETFTAKDGLSSDIATAILEDREGDVWVGTSNGLDRFRVANVVLETSIPQQSRGGFILFTDHRGVLYAGDSDTLYRVAPGGTATPILHNISDPQALCESSDGDVWLVAFKSLYRVRGDTAKAVSPPPKGRNFLRCQADPSGGLLFLTTAGEFFRFDTTYWTLESKLAKRPDQVPTYFVFDRQGRRLAFYENEGLMRLDNQKLSPIWPLDRVPGGRVGPPYLGSQAILIGAVAGLARIRGERADQVEPSYAWLRHVTGIAETRTGDTWLQSTSGIVRLRSAELQDAFDHPGRPLDPEIFDVRDGLPGANQVDFGDNGATVGGDGRVWFTTSNGVVWIDPARLYRNPFPPPVAITRAIADSRRFDDPTAVILPAGTKNLEFDYTALSLQAPERVRFKYRLVGVDDRWVDAGGRRQAFYAKLPPGSYRFKVIASNNDGVWNPAGREISVELPPTFLQSWAFKLLCVALALVGLWVVYRLRMTAITNQLRTTLETRLRERERIARELHDTLLQGVQGLILRFQGVADRIADQPLPSKLMEQALERAEELLVEGRDRVHGLRAPPASDDLAVLLTATAERAELGPQTSIEVRTTGRRRAVDPVVREELAWIVREALSNVARHAEASSVTIHIRFGWARLTVDVSDDGKGFDGENGSPARQEKHFGLTGMGERAKRIGAALGVRSAGHRRGTTITVAVPAPVAYATGLFRRALAALGFVQPEQTG